VRRRALISTAGVLAVAGGLLLAGCGGRTVTPTPETVIGTVPTTPQATGNAAAGKTVFLTAGCKSCHTLKVAAATRTVGPHLDEKKPPASLVVDRVTTGKGVMPSFSSQLTPQQIADVAAYVSQATKG